MYWPIGAPRIYAASNNAARDRILHLDDDAESRETTEGSGSLVDAGVDSEDRSEDETASDVSTPLSPITPGIKPVEHDSHHRLPTKLVGQDTTLSEPVETQPLLALRTSRTGHLFAVITSSSLTIWQTKVYRKLPFRSRHIRYLTRFVANCNPSSSCALQQIIEYIWSKCVPSRAS